MTLPAAAEVLREGLVLVRGLTSGPHDLTRARLLLDYARELREGSERVPAPADDSPAPIDAITQIITERPLGGVMGQCRWCGERIRYARMSTDHRQSSWYHELTIQAVCSTSGQTHTFAEPIGERS
jgi:hypothetical protein